MSGQRFDDCSEHLSRSAQIAPKVSFSFSSRNYETKDASKGQQMGKQFEYTTDHAMAGTIKTYGYC